VKLGAKPKCERKPTSCLSPRLISYRVALDCSTLPILPGHVDYCYYRDPLLLTSSVTRIIGLGALIEPDPLLGQVRGRRIDREY
jgi:hypothetical protein